ncbi:MAG: MotA/TolQ/ExbB proton channel family protein [Pseudomonadales bacterium]|nr:MotA/TolQ/ExbB proton channel family protein [Pseudomonadales bacterium]
MQGLEELMYQLSDLFLAPVLVLLVLLFAYSLYALGEFGCQVLQRRYYRQAYQQAVSGVDGINAVIKGYPLAEHFYLAQAPGKNNAILTKDYLDVAALKELEAVRTVSRLAPMLGLIATMVPMGPALKSLADGNVQGISDNLIVAFSAVIFGLVIASITFWIASIKKRWLATELVDLLPLLNSQENPDDEPLATMENEREAA